MKPNPHEQTEPDPVFGVPSYSRRGARAFASGEDSPEYRRACDIHQRATNLRDEAIDVPAGVDPEGEKGTPLSAAKISALGNEFSDLITSTEGDEIPALSTWREAMPLILEDDFREKLDIGGSGGPLTYYDKGSEALVFIDEAREFVYKITPIKEMVLDIPAIAGDEPVYAKPIAHPLCNQFGAITMFQRNEVFNLLPGLAKTEILVIAETQQVITKQPFLGEVEPTMKELQQWAAKHGYVNLPPQADDLNKVAGTDLPVTEGASSAMPILCVKNNECYLAVDVVPRNARKLPNGEVFVFDMTPRPLRPAEIMANPQIQDALARFIDTFPEEKTKSDMRSHFSKVLPLPGASRRAPYEDSGLGGFGD